MARSSSRSASALKAENAELRERLERANRERHLLVQAVGHMAAGAGAKPSLDTIRGWLIATIEGLTKDRPVTGDRSMSQLHVPIARLEKIINDRWFPNGGGFQDGEIQESTKVGDLAYAIWVKL